MLKNKFYCILLLTLLITPVDGQAEVCTAIIPHSNEYYCTKDNKHKVLRRNRPFSVQVTERNTVYEIRYIFDLDRDVTIPEGSVLVFNGGMVRCGNHVLSGKKMPTEVVYSVENFGAGETNDDTKAIQSALNLCYNVRFDSNYNVYASSSNKTRDNSVLSVPSYTHIYLNGTVFYKTPDLDRYSIFNLTSVSNVQIEGKGSIVGDKSFHAGNKNGWGFGIKLNSSHDIIIDGPSIYDMWADGIYLGYDYPFCKDVRLCNCEIYNCRRQGITITAGKSISINDFYIHDIPPGDLGCGIDLENEARDEYSDGAIDNISIRRGVIENCHFGIVVQTINPSLSGHGVYNIDIDNVNCLSPSRFKFPITARNSTFGEVMMVNTCMFSSCEIQALTEVHGAVTNPKAVSTLLDCVVNSYVTHANAIGVVKFVNSTLDIQPAGIIRNITGNISTEVYNSKIVIAKEAIAKEFFNIYNLYLYDSTFDSGDNISGQITAYNSILKARLEGTRSGVIWSTVKLYNCDVYILGTRNTALYNMNRGEMTSNIVDCTIYDIASRKESIKGAGRLIDTGTRYYLNGELNTAFRDIQ